MCRRCKRHVEPGKTMCKHHLAEQRKHQRWADERKKNSPEGREKELEKLIRSQAADMKRGRRNDAQRFGPGRVRTVLLSAFLSFDNEPNWDARQPWETRGEGTWRRVPSVSKW